MTAAICTPLQTIHDMVISLYYSKIVIVKVIYSFFFSELSFNCTFSKQLIILLSIKNIQI